MKWSTTLSKKIEPHHDGIQFPIQSGKKTPSTTHTAKQILKAALQSVNSPYVLQLNNVNNPLPIAQKGLDKAKALFTFNRAEQSHTLSDAMIKIKDQPFEQFILKGKGDATIEPWFIPYQGQKLQGDALLQQIDLWAKGH